MSGATTIIVSLVATQVLALLSGLLIMYLSRRPRAIERETKEAATFTEYRGILENQRQRLEDQVKTLEARTLAAETLLDKATREQLEQMIRSDRELSEARREIDRLRGSAP